MPLDTVIFDIDGLLIDSEPLWNEAADEVFNEYGITLTHQQYLSTTGLRTKEFVDQWFNYFGISKNLSNEAEQQIIVTVLKKIKERAEPMNGVQHIFNYFHNRQFKIGIATSSPQELIDLVVEMLGIKSVVQATASAQKLPHGKPHPQVYLDCAEKLGSDPTSCICFEDSFNGMIAVKAARMKCVVIPHHALLKEERWAAADLKLSSLQNFGDLHFGIVASK